MTDNIVYFICDNKLYFYKIPKNIKYQNSKEWLDETLEKIDEIMLTQKEKNQIEKWNEQLLESWKKLPK